MVPAAFPLVVKLAKPVGDALPFVAGRGVLVPVTKFVLPTGQRVAMLAMFSIVAPILPVFRRRLLAKSRHRDLDVLGMSRPLRKRNGEANRGNRDKQQC